MIHRRFNYSILIVLLSVFSIGCSSKQERIKKLKIEEPPKYQLAQEAPPAVKKSGSLYSRRGPSLFADKKDLQIGDIIIVSVEEFLENKSSDTVTTSKSNNTSTKGGLISPASNTSDRLTSAIGKANGILGIGFTGGSQQSFKGTSNGSNKDTFRTRISTMIEKKYQNGNYFIVGSKTMLINGQQQTVKISGIIRPYDIDPEFNQVNSEQVANLKILYKKAGANTSETEKGWGSKLLDAISPF